MDSYREIFLVKSLKKYSEIPNEEIAALYDKLKIKVFKKNEFFLQQGDSCNSLALIHKGLFRVFCIDYSGNEKTLSFRKEGQFLAGYSPYIEKKEIWYSIQALELSEAIYLSFDDFNVLKKRHSCWNELIKNYVTELFIEKENRERSLLLENATTRYRNFLRDFPEYERNISQYHIASYLGITPVSLSRIKKHQIESHVTETAR